MIFQTERYKGLCCITAVVKGKKMRYVWAWREPEACIARVFEMDNCFPDVPTLARSPLYATSFRDADEDLVTYGLPDGKMCLLVPPDGGTVLLKKEEKGNLLARIQGMSAEQRLLLLKQLARS
jgi:hypothetical protein